MKAILVVHGIGDQLPLETLEQFSEGYVKSLKAKGEEVSLTHRVSHMIDPEDAESSIRLSSSKGDIDIYELYWADLAEGHVSSAEIFEWLERTVKASQDYFSDNEELQSRYEQNDKDYAHRLTKLLKKGYWVFKILGILGAWVYRNRVVNAIVGLVQGPVTKVLTSYVGDVSIYTVTDPKDKHFTVKEKILRKSYLKLKAILDDPEYDEVVLAGHSLGSVIAYDTLNVLNLQANLDSAVVPKLNKLRGLVTFGSPLDKIAFFFRNHAKDGVYVRRQLLAHLNGFKMKNLYAHRFKLEPGDDQYVSNPVERKLEELPWINWYHEQDPVSGHLDFYNTLENRCCEFKNPDHNKWGVSHVHYWSHDALYDSIEEIFEKGVIVNPPEVPVAKTLA